MSDTLKAKPSIAVVVPAFKAEKYIAKTIESVSAQSDIETEIIIVEDGVFDNTAKKLPKLKNLKHIQLERNGGAPKARNIGLSHINSPYIMFLDSDDYVEGNLLFSLWESLEKSGASLSFGKCMKAWENSDRKSIFVPPAGESEFDVLIRWLEGNHGPGSCSVLWRTSEILRIGGWNESFKRNQDGELVIRALLSGCKVTQAYDGLGIYRIDSGPSVSKINSYETFMNQEALETLVMSKSDQFGNSEILDQALNAFRFEVARRAYRCGLVDVGKQWEQKWRSNGGRLPGVLGGRFYRLAHAIAYSALGIQRGDRLLDDLRSRRDRLRIN